MSDINVTPFVDVMLVLLVIFMITAPLLAAGVQVDLPRVGADAVPTEDAPLTIAIDRQGTVFLQDEPVAIADLGSRLGGIAENNPEARIFLRADEGVAYGQVMVVVAAVNGAGLRRVALLTDPTLATDRGDSDRGGASAHR